MWDMQPLAVKDMQPLALHDRESLNPVGRSLELKYCWYLQISGSSYTIFGIEIVRFQLTHDYPKCTIRDDTSKWDNKIGTKIIWANSWHQMWLLSNVDLIYGNQYLTITQKISILRLRLRARWPWKHITHSRFARTKKSEHLRLGHALSACSYYRCQIWDVGIHWQMTDSWY